MFSSRHAVLDRQGNSSYDVFSLFWSRGVFEKQHNVVLHDVIYTRAALRIYGNANDQTFVKHSQVLSIIKIVHLLTRVG